MITPRSLRIRLLEISEGFGRSFPRPLSQVIFSSPTEPGDLYRPLVLASFSLTHALVGLKPFLYHLTNVLFHAGASVLLFLILRRIFAREVAIVTAFFFVLHP